MSRISLLLLAVMTFSVGCGYGSHSNYMGGGGMGGPQINQLQPNMATVGGPPFALTVNGSGFGIDAVVYWNAVAHATTYVTGNQVTTQISTSDIMNAGMVPVYVRTGGRNSNSVNFTVQ